MRILSVAEMKDLESEADGSGHHYDHMMALAGRGVADAILQEASVEGRRVLVLVGSGNNGGDGLVAASLLQQAGADVTAYLTHERSASKDSVYADARKQGVEIMMADDDADHVALRQLAQEADLIIDALLGTGATPPVRSTIAEVLRVVTAVLAEPHSRRLTNVRWPSAPEGKGRRVVAVDGPSGLDFDTGEIDDLALSADVTVTFAAPKWGHVKLPGAAKVGELIVADIGISDVVEMPEGPMLASPDLVRAWLPPRPMDAHKGTFGKVMIVAGSANYTGAAVLCATSAIRTGAGLVTLALPSTLHTAVVPALPEATYVLLPHALGVVDERAVPVLLEHLNDYDALLIGPGLGRTPETHDFLEQLLSPNERQRSTGFVKRAEREENEETLPPLIIDADGLNLLSELSDWPKRLPPGTILTPHPGEMGRLTDTGAGDVQAARVEMARTWAERWQQTVVLKGAFTVIAAPDREPVLLPFANPALSTAGTGDVLAGAIAALRAQGLAPFEAAVVGGYLHGLAGEIVAVAVGKVGVAAGDVARALTAAWQRLAA